MSTKVGQRGLQKITSLQAWSKLTNKYFGKKLRIEERKDREEIYELLKRYGLPSEKFRAFSSGSELTEPEFMRTIGELGLPYWISATPHENVEDLERLTKLGIETAKDGWEFIKNIPRLSDYKVIIMEYPFNIIYKGTAIVSTTLNGIVDFVKGDKHYQLTSGLTQTDPMLFTSEKILRFSSLAPKDHQEILYTHINDRPGHYEFQYGTKTSGETGLSFFDYDDRPAYEDNDSLFQDLVIYFEKDLKTNGFDIKGLPANLGKVKGKCRVVYSSDTESFKKVKDGEILITDATNPDMTVIMKKVIAIVADLGGVTSHAAIVCRELGIPAIVGTKNATQILKTGMQVEVDAFNGTVKILDM